MNHATNPQCQCTTCPGQGCNCGCQNQMAKMATAPTEALPSHCACGPACRCDAAEQGCLCR